MRAKSREFPTGRIAPASERIRARVLALTDWRAAEAVACYLATEREVQTMGIVRQAWAEGKAVCVPKHDPPSGRYRWTWLQASDKCVRGPMRIPEPETLDPVPAGAIRLVLVPGVAFDRHGGRLGHGAGHYDRLLRDASCRGAVRVGLAFDWQMADELPMTAHDVRMDGVIVESETIRREGSRTDEGGEHD
jgi:5-formyltetrahydrofolate cyclo-ligase